MDLRVIVRGLRTSLRGSQLRVKASWGRGGVGSFGQISNQNFSLFHKALPPMRLVSKKPAKLDLNGICDGIFYCFGDE